MKRLFFGSLAAIFGLAAVANGQEWEKPTLTEGEKQERRFTPEILLKMGRVGSATPSPTSDDIIYTINYQNVEKNNSSTKLYLLPGGDWDKMELISDSKSSDHSPTWSKDGKGVYLSSRDGSSQLWYKEIGSKKSRKISSIATGINSYEISSNENAIWYTSQVKVDQTAKDMHPDMERQT